MEITFKYQIGDMLTHRAMVLPPSVTIKDEPQRLFVVGRLMDECPGGIQLHYRVRPVSTGWQCSFTKDVFQLHEGELAPFPVKDTAKP